MKIYRMPGSYQSNECGAFPQNFPKTVNLLAMRIEGLGTNFDLLWDPLEGPSRILVCGGWMQGKWLDGAH